MVGSKLPEIPQPARLSSAPLSEQLGLSIRCFPHQASASGGESLEEALYVGSCRIHQGVMKTHK